MSYALLVPVLLRQTPLASPTRMSAARVGSTARRANRFALSEVMSRAFCKNISLPFFGTLWLCARHPASIGGANASSRTWGGLRWTLFVARDERGEGRTVKACGPDPPTLGSSQRISAGDGG